MAEDLYIPKEASKREKYELLLPQLKALTEDEPDLFANMANISAALKEAFDFFGSGFTGLSMTSWCWARFRDR